MEQTVIAQFCAMLDKVIMNAMAICVCMKFVKGSIMATFVPSECDYQDGVHIVSEDDDEININNIDEISYDEIEDMYEIKSGEISFYISCI